MKASLRINRETYSRLYEKKIDVGVNGVDFYEGDEVTSEVLEARQWIDCIINDKEPLVKPEQALVVTQF